MSNMAAADEPDVGPYKINYMDSLGQGYFGSVTTATNLETGVIVAAKKIVASREVVPFVKREIDVLKASNKPGHVNIIKHIDEYEQKINTIKSQFFLFSEFYSLGTLSEYAGQFFLGKNHILHVSKQLASALAYIHTLQPHRIVHRDVKPDNILFTNQNGQHILKLADLGVSFIVVTMLQDEPVHSKAGTETYWAPEFFNVNEQGEIQYDNSGSVDIFAAGLIFYQMIMAKQGEGIYFKEVVADRIGQKMWENYRASNSTASNLLTIRPRDTNILQKFKLLIKAMVQYDPCKRTPMVEVERELTDLSPITPPLPPQHPPWTTAPLTLTKLHQHQVTFMMDGVCYGYINDGAIVEDNNTKTVMQLSLNSDSSYRIVCKMQDLYGISGRWKFFTDSGLMVTGASYDNNTFVWTRDLEEHITFSGDYGYIRGVIHGDKLLYAKKIEESRWQLDVYSSDDHRHIRTLLQTVTNYGISASSHTSGWTVITNYDYPNYKDHTMDIYTPALDHHRRIRLPFRVRSYNGVLSVKTVIIVACSKPPALYMYNWGGDEVGILTAGNLGIDDGRMVGIGPGGKDRVQIATGEWDEERQQPYVKRLHVYQVGTVS